MLKNNVVEPSSKKNEKEGSFLINMPSSTKCESRNPSTSKIGLFVTVVDSFHS